MREEGRQAMKGQSNGATETIQVQPTKTLGQAPRSATGLRVKTHVKAGQMILQILME